ncbi:MAG: hypothetical protein AN487_24520, partial [Anabaena sp. CRKS33]
DKEFSSGTQELLAWPLLRIRCSRKRGEVQYTNCGDPMGEVTKPVGTGLKGRDLIHSAPLFFKIHGWATAMPSVVDN